MFRRLLLRLSNLAPPALRRWIYRHPRLLNPLAKTLKLAVPADGQVVVTISCGPNHGMKWAVDRSTPNYYWMQQYEAEVEQALRQVLRPGMVVADVGAHLGFDTLLFSRAVGPEGLVLSFEPDPHNLVRLRRNCELNQLQNVHVIEAAVGDRPGTVQFRADASATGQVVPDEQGDGNVISVPAVTLDSVAFSGRVRQRLELAKIDVEDHEASVLRGARRVLAEMKPALLIEVHSRRSLEACLEEIEPRGYRIERIECAASPTTQEGFKIVHLFCQPAEPRPDQAEDSLHR